jgi:hypothetical protein
MRLKKKKDPPSPLRWVLNAITITPSNLEAYPGSRNTLPPFTHMRTHTTAPYGPTVPTAPTTTTTTTNT